MNIWEAYCNPSYYNVYFNILTDTGITRKSADQLKYQYSVYLQRLKESILAQQLRACSTIDSFKDLLTDIFYNKWKNNLKFVEMPSHFFAYLEFLDTIQALHNDFINTEEKERLVGGDFDFPILELTKYETQYLNEGKLVALMNPQLISLIKDFIEQRQAKPSQAAYLCQDFYRKLLPEMSIEDYYNLILKLWSPSKSVKRSKRRISKIRISFPDGNESILTPFEALRTITLFYGFNDVFTLKLQISGHPLFMKYIPIGSEKYYDAIGENQFLYNMGDAKGRINSINVINIHFGNKLKIEQV